MPYVNTVLGPIHPAEIGVCSLHEHLIWSDPGWEFSPTAKEVFDPPAVFSKVYGDLSAFREAGGRTMLDCSGIGIGREPELYAVWSRYSGVQVVCCTGFWARDKILPYFQAQDLDYITDLMVRELTVGMQSTAIKAGAIKVGNSRGNMWPEEELTFRAAARASNQTGALIVTHGVNFAELQVEILKDEGVDPSRVIISHLDAAYNLDYERDLRIAQQGFFIGYDHIGTDPDWSPQPYAMKDSKRVELVLKMIDAGQIERLVLANDTNSCSVGLAHRATPKHTFAHLITGFADMLRSAGVTDEQLNTMLVDTPRRALPMG
jgi:predicted metal-dependent phosphotriesterase family hydrolase